MKFVLLNYETDQQSEARNDPKRAEAYWASYMSYGEALEKAGILHGGEGLEHHTTATTVSNKDGKRHVQDGPFADSKEKLGGFHIIDVPDLDKALEWASRSPAASGGGKVEVRPLLVLE